MIFDGKKVAQDKELQSKKEVEDLKRQKIIPKLVSILIGNDPSSKLFLSLKQKAAERIGAELKIVRLDQNIRKEKIVQLIKELNKKKDVNGIMLQLPLPKNFTWDDRNEVINSIDSKKDVDGMREDSKYVTPVVKAVLAVLKFSRKAARRVAVIGAKGFVGKKIVKELKKKGYEVEGYDIETENFREKTSKADILISATGVSDLVRGEMVKDGAIVIDVGSPKGDVRFNEVSKRASLITPVPGGIGPVTISSLLENLIESASKEGAQI